MDMLHTKMGEQCYSSRGDPVILVGLNTEEEESARHAIEETARFQVGGAYRTYGEALDLLKSVYVQFVILSTRLSDMSLTTFLEQANRQFEVHAAEVIPEGVTDKDVSLLAIEGLNSGRVVNFMRAPVTSDQIDQIYQDLIFRRSCGISKRAGSVSSISVAG